jgi:hypothetical protein
VEYEVGFLARYFAIGNWSASLSRRIKRAPFYFLLFFILCHSHIANHFHSLHFVQLATDDQSQP